MDLKEYWTAVRKAGDEIAAGGQRSVFITSLDIPLKPEWRAGIVCEATPYLAGRGIVDRTHRLATSEEIETFKAEQKRREAACAATTAILNRQTRRTVLSRQEIDEVRQS